jgi:hypothetical protein
MGGCGRSRGRAEGRSAAWGCYPRGRGRRDGCGPRKVIRRRWRERRRWGKRWGERRSLRQRERGQHIRHDAADGRYESARTKRGVDEAGRVLHHPGDGRGISEVERTGDDAAERTGEAW